MYQDPIIVVGLPRSGTSVTAGVLHCCGAWGGDEKELDYADNNNPHGYFENTPLFGSLRANVNPDPYCEILGDNSLSAKLKLLLVPEMKPWFFKHHYVLYDTDWEMSHVPAFRDTFPNAKWLIVRRDNHGIKDSQNFVWENDPPDYIANHSLERLEQMRLLLDSDADTFEIWPFEEMHKPGLDGFRDMVEWAGLEWDEPAVRALVDPNLHHFGAGGSGAPVYDPE